MASVAMAIFRCRNLWSMSNVIPSSFSSNLFSHYTTGTDASSHMEKTSAASAPPPIRVSLTENSGRGVFASRSISAGDLIHTASPVVAHPAPSLTSKVCYYCLRRRGYGDAGATVSDRYFCCDACWKKSEDFLAKETRLRSSAFDNHCINRGLKYPFLVKRLASMVVAGKISPDALDILQPAVLNADMISETEEEFDLLKQSFLETDVDDSLISFLKKEWYIGVLARIRINSFRVETIAASYDDMLDMASSSVMADSGVGNALYMLPSFYNHDCDPNAHVLWIDNADAKIKALRDVQTDEELRICYIDASMDREARRSILYHGFGFLCRCSKCMAGD